jgi:hypothetical protein
MLLSETFATCKYWVLKHYILPNITISVLYGTRVLRLRKNTYVFSIKHSLTLEAQSSSMWITALFWKHKYFLCGTDPFLRAHQLSTWNAALLQKATASQIFTFLTFVELKVHVVLTADRNWTISWSS